MYTNINLELMRQMFLKPLCSYRYVLIISKAGGIDLILKVFLKLRVK